MNELRICTMNCRGLGDYRKRRDVFHYLRRSNFNIYLLQDIHCQKKMENIFRNAWGTDILIAPFKSNARGVAILTKGIQVKVCECRIDDEGNFIVAKVTLNDTIPVLLVNIYGPNDDSPDFYENIGNRRD